MTAKKIFILIFALLLILGAFYYGKQFLMIDKCLDNGGSFSYENNECVFESLLNNIDLSDKSVSSMSRNDLWQIGVKYLAWPEELPSEATKEEIHQKLLDAKYAKVGDLGDGNIEITTTKDLLEGKKSK